MCERARGEATGSSAGRYHGTAIGQAKSGTALGYEYDDVKRAILPSNTDICAHHAPDDAAIQRISNIRLAAAHFMDVIDRNCPPCADRTDAKRKVREAMFTANASIVLRGAV